MATKIVATSSDLRDQIAVTLKDRGNTVVGTGNEGDLHYVEFERPPAATARPE